VTQRLIRSVRGADLKDQDFPLDVKFGGGWRQIHYVSMEMISDTQIVRLWDRDGQEVARIYPDSIMSVRD
jgi:hypothetical protein